MKHKTAWAKALPLLLLFLILTLRQTALAADYRVAFSDPTVIVGNEVTVNVHVSPACAGYSLVLYYDSNYLQFLSSGGGSNLSCNADETTIRLFDMVMSATEQEFRCTLTFKAKQIGRTTISITEASVSDNSGNEVEPTNKGTSVVTINAQPTYSSEARLSSLTLRPGNLSPAFSPDTYDYRVTVDSSTTSLTASYTAMESHATVSMPSFTDLKVGENSFRITVTAQDGTTKKTYRIVVVRQAPPETQPQPTQPTQPPTEPPTEAPTEPPATEPQEVIFSGTAVELTLLDFPIGFSIPEGYRLIHAMAANGVLYERLEPVGVEEVNHYLLYGVTGDGRTALYRYDLIEKTLQRYGFEILAEGPASEPGGEPADDSTEETQESSGEDTTEEPDTGSLSEPSGESPRETEAHTARDPEDGKQSTEVPVTQAPGDLLSRLRQPTSVPAWIWYLVLILLAVFSLVFLVLLISGGSRKELQEPQDLPEDKDLSPEEEEEYLSFSSAELEKLVQEHRERQPRKKD